VKLNLKVAKKKKPQDTYFDFEMSHPLWWFSWWA